MSEAQTGAAAPVAEASNSTANATQHNTNPSPTTNAHNAPNAHPTSHTTAPTANATTPFPGTHGSPEEPSTFNDKLNAADRYWKFKFAFYGILIITGLIGIGCIGWLVSTNTAWNPIFGYGFDSWTLWPSLITFTVSIVWSTVCILVLVTRKQPVHPGVRVALDLLLWLGFITTVLFATYALVDMMSWGDYGITTYGYSSGRSGYELAANGTWVWEQDSSYISTPRRCNGSSSYDYYSTPTFKDCDEQDAYVNKLWQEKPRRTNVELAGVVCQYFGLVLHLALFIWACVDTHVYNRSKVSSDAEKLAAGIVQTMISNGAVVPPPGQAYVRPGMYYQLPPQQAYPMANMHPQAQQGYMQHPHMQQPQPRMAGPSVAPGVGLGQSTEKSSGLR